VFHVGTGLSDAERNEPPPIGSIVTYRYQELSTDGVPRFPSYVGVRHDVAWPPPAPSPGGPGTSVAASPASPASPTPAAPPAPPRPTPTAPAPTAVAADPAIGPDRPRRIFARGDARWSIELDGRAVRLRVEEPGAPVEITSRHSASQAAAWRDAERLIADRLGHGYVEIL